MNKQKLFSKFFLVTLKEILFNPFSEYCPCFPFFALSHPSPYPRRELILATMQRNTTIHHTLVYYFSSPRTKIPFVESVLFNQTFQIYPLLIHARSSVFSVFFFVLNPSRPSCYILLVLIETNTRQHLSWLLSGNEKSSAKVCLQ